MENYSKIILFRACKDTQNYHKEIGKTLLGYVVVSTITLLTLWVFRNMESVKDFVCQALVAVPIAWVIMFILTFLWHLFLAPFKICHERQIEFESKIAAITEKKIIASQNPLDEAKTKLNLVRDSILNVINDAPKATRIGEDQIAIYEWTSAVQRVLLETVNRNILNKFFAPTAMPGNNKIPEAVASLRAIVCNLRVEDLR